tara:strand:+ start:7920 stop:8600 length:681 start_codon:yes stop_codon:yes gene_type:complete
MTTAFLDTIFKPSPEDVKNMYDPRPARILEINRHIEDSMDRYHEMMEDVSHVLSQVNAYKMDRDLVSKAEPLNFTDLCEKITTTFNTVEKTAFHDGSLCVLTTDLIAKDNGGDGRPIKIEPHLIVLSIAIRESKFIPVGDSLYEGYGHSMIAHPHCIGANNLTACLGTFSGVLLEHIANDDYVSAVETCLSFLQSYNSEDSAGALWHRWPLVEEPPLVLVDIGVTA